MDADDRHPVTLDGRALQLELEAVVGALDACRHGELRRAMREKDAPRLGIRGGGEGLVGTEVPARLAVVDAPVERRLADEEVAPTCKLDEPIARPAVSGIGDRRAVRGQPKPIRLQRVVREPQRSHGNTCCRELPLGLVLEHGEHPVEHVSEPESLTELLEDGATPGVQPELGALVDRDAAGAVHRAPYPRDEIAPVVEVEVGDRDRVDVRPAFSLSEAREDTRAAVDEQPTAQSARAGSRNVRRPGWARRVSSR